MSKPDNLAHCDPFSASSLGWICQMCTAAFNPLLLGTPRPGDNVLELSEIFCYRCLNLSKRVGEMIDPNTRAVYIEYLLYDIAF